MRTTTVPTVFQMLLCSIRFLQSACVPSAKITCGPTSFSVFRDTEKLSCVNGVSASKLPYLTGLFPVIEIPFFQIYKVRVLCALKTCADPILQPRSPVMDCRGFFCLQKLS